MALVEQRDRAQMLDGETRSGGLVVRPMSATGGVHLRCEEVLLPLRVELAQVVPEANEVGKFAGTEWLREFGCEFRDTGEVPDEVVPLSVAVG
jgi:hypothetical protein